MAVLISWCSGRLYLAVLYWHGPGMTVFLCCTCVCLAGSCFLLLKTGMRDGFGGVLNFRVPGVVLCCWFLVIFCVGTGMRDGLGMNGGLGSVVS